MSWALRRADRVIAVSEGLRELAIELGVDPRRVKTIPNGINCRCLLSPRSRCECRSRHGIDPAERIILSAGDLAELKGHHRVIAAVKTLNDRGVRARLLIAGGVGRSGRYAETLRRAGQRQGTWRSGHVPGRGDAGGARRADVRGRRLLPRELDGGLAQCRQRGSGLRDASRRDRCRRRSTDGCFRSKWDRRAGSRWRGARRGVARGADARMGPRGDCGPWTFALVGSGRRRGPRARCGRSWRRASRTPVSRARGRDAVVRGLLRNRDGREMRRTAVIVNADDLGMSRRSTRPRSTSWRRAGSRRRRSWRTRRRRAQAARRVAKFPRCSFGVHLNLTQFEPLTGGPGARLLVNERGQMSRAIETARPVPCATACRLSRSSARRSSGWRHSACASAISIRTITCTPDRLSFPRPEGDTEALPHPPGRACPRISIRRTQAMSAPICCWQKRAYNWALKSHLRDAHDRRVHGIPHLLPRRRRQKAVDRPDRADGPSRRHVRRCRDRDPRKRLGGPHEPVGAVDFVRAAC